MLKFDRTAGTQQAGADDPTVASFGGGTPTQPTTKQGANPDAAGLTGVIMIQGKAGSGGDSQFRRSS